MRKLIIAMCLVSVAFSVSFAASVPRSTAADSRIKIVTYDPNNIVILKERYGYQTQITFAANEIVQSVSIGDSSAWQVVPLNNNLFIKPTAMSKTNMSVLTNLNSYNFQLDSTNEKTLPTYKLQFTYPEAGYDQSGKSNAVGTFSPDKINWKYSFTGEKSLAPVEAFDNGQFTYFKFKNDGMSHLPSIFIVDKNKNETLVNYHIEGRYMVINVTAKQFTFRDGASVTNIYNDEAIGDWSEV
jgi:type IV secretion system protein VirB9